MFNVTDIPIYWLLASLISLQLIIILERLDDPVKHWHGFEWEENLVMSLLFPVGIIIILSKIVKLLIPVLQKFARIEL